MSKNSDAKKTTANKKKEAQKLMRDDQMRACHAAIHTATIAAGAGGIIPVPVMDAVPISAAQVAMVIALGNIFDQKVGESTAKGLISAAASTLVGRSLVKMIPIVGWGISAAVAAGVTEAIGWTVAVDFARNSKNSETPQKTETPQENESPKNQGTSQKSEPKTTSDPETSQKAKSQSDPEIPQETEGPSDPETSQEAKNKSDPEISQKTEGPSKPETSQEAENQSKSEKSPVDRDDQSMARWFNDDEFRKE